MGLPRPAVPYRSRANGLSVTVKWKWMHVNVVIWALTGLGLVGLPRPAPLPDALLQIGSITAGATSRGKMMHVLRGGHGSFEYLTQPWPCRITSPGPPYCKGGLWCRSPAASPAPSVCLAHRLGKLRNTCSFKPWCFGMGSWWSMLGAWVQTCGVGPVLWSVT